MNPPKTAIIRLASCNENTQFLFCSKIAGLSPFKRLIFSMQRAGIDNFLVFHENSPFVNNHEIEKDIKNDPRFKSNFQWKLLEKDGLKKNSTTDNLDPNVDKVLLVEGNLITTTRLIKDFIDSACSFETNEIVGLINESGFPDGIYLLTPSDVENYLDSESFEKKLIPARLPGPWLYRDRVENSRSLCLVEKKLLNEHKLHYRQFMDIWFSSLFSIPISSFLVKTFLTPNQVTVIGLFIGLASGFFFAQGNYLSGIIGGLLLVATAIWDCCDGDVARLKFMESDFGESLDTTCDNIINIFVFTGIMLGVASSKGLAQALTPFFLLSVGGCLIFFFIYFPKGGKGSFFKNTPIYNVIQILASRNFIYIIFIFCVFGKLDWFLWCAGIGSNIFAFSIYIMKRKILLSISNDNQK